MLCENRKELNSLTESANFNGKEIENLKGSLKKATDTNKELKNIISPMNNRLKTMDQDLENQRETERLSEEPDNLEQYSRKNSVEIHGIPQDAYTNTEQVVIKLAEALNITVEPEDIEISHKINKGKAIIAKFVNVQRANKTKGRQVTRSVSKISCYRW